MGNEVTIIVRARETATRTFGRVAQSIKNLGPMMARTLAKAASYGTAVGAVFTGPVVTGILGATKAVIALGRASAQLAPLAAFLPSLVASAGLLKGTLMLAGPGMLKAIQPITKEFANTEKEVGGVTKAVQAAASRGLPELAKAFVRVNLPSIRKGMVGIAESVNRVTVETGKWINSLEGQRLIKTVTEATDRAAERLAPKLSNAAIALGRLADRAGDRAIIGLGNLLGRAADKAAELMNNVSKADIENAMKKARDAGEGLVGKLIKIKEAIIWLGEHQDVLIGISDALAMTSIAVGAASGNWVAVIAGAATLILNHFDSLKKGVSKIWNAIASDPGVQMIWDAIMRIARSIKEDLQDAFEAARPYIEMFGQALKDAWDKAAPLIAKFLENPNVVAGIKAIALGIAGLAVAFISMQVAITLTVGAIVGALAGALTWLVGTFVTGVLSSVAMVIRAFGQMLEKVGEAMSKLPGRAGEIGRQMKKIGQDAQAAAGQVEGLRDRLSGLQSKTVTVTFGARLTQGSGEIFRAYGYGQGLGVLKRRTGGPVGARSRAATGGPRWGGVLVGEDGPEVVDLAPGSNVTSAAQTRGRMASGGSGGPATVVLEINSSGSDIDNMLLKILRRSIRARGGNVQLVLGKGA